MGESFGSRLRQHRGVRGLTQEELAERAGLTVQAISLLERGLRRPRSTTVAFLADALRLDAHERATFIAADPLQRAAEARAQDGDAGAAPLPPGHADPRPAVRSRRRSRRRTLAMVGLPVALVAVVALAVLVTVDLVTAPRVAPAPTCSSSYPW